MHSKLNEFMDIQPKSSPMRILTLTLSLPLHAGDIPAFRGGIVDLVGKEHELFHNHDNTQEESDHYHWDYPLIQYTVRRGRATIIGLDAGADALQQILIPKLFGQLQFAGREYGFKGLQLKEHQHHWQLLEEPQLYGLFGWLALNQTNYADWKANTHPESRNAILNRALTGHLRVLAKAAGVEELDQVVGSVVQVDNQKRVTFHGTQFVRFHALINSTLALPFGLGLGRAVAFGFGEILPLRVYQNMIQHQSTTLDAEL